MTPFTTRSPHHYRPALAVTFAVGLLIWPLAGAVASTITPGAVQKLTVYQGVAMIVPGGGSMMEIGNAGRDIVGTDEIYIRPGSLNSGVANYAKFYNAGGKASLRIPGELCFGDNTCQTTAGGGSGTGPVVHHSIGNLAENTVGHTKASHYEIARIGYVPFQWTANSSVMVELHEKYWGSGGYKKYEVWAGYSGKAAGDTGFHLVEASASKAQPTTMPEVRLSLGAPVLTGQCLGNPTCHPAYYLPVYIDVDNYTNWDVVVTHNMAETDAAVPSWGQVHFYDNPVPTSEVASFIEDDVVTNTFTTRFAPQADIGAGGAVEGGEIQLQGAVPSGAPAYNTWIVDAWQNRFRIFSGGMERFAIDASGNVNLWNGGSLCFGGGNGDCRNTWVGLGGPGTDWPLNSVLTLATGGNKSDSTIILGQGTGKDIGTAMFDATTTTRDAVSGKQTGVNNTKSAIYGQNASANGWAGYFAGRMNVTDKLYANEFCLPGAAGCVSSWPAGSSDPVIRHPIGNLSAGNDPVNPAKRFEIARIGYDPWNWSANTSVFVELNQKFWGPGGYKKYEVRAGYIGVFGDGSYRLVSATGSPLTMPEGRVVISTWKVWSDLSNHYYISVYVEADDYTSWDVVVSHNMTESAGDPVTAQIRIFENPTPANIPAFSETDVVKNEYANSFASGLVANKGTSSAGNAKDTISAYNADPNTGTPFGSAIYAQQNSTTGYAGYFSNGAAGSTTKPTLYAENLGLNNDSHNAAIFKGGLLVQQYNLAALPSFESNDLAKFVSNNDPQIQGGYALKSISTYDDPDYAGVEQSGFAGGFLGHVDITGSAIRWCASCGTNRLAALDVHNSAPDSGMINRAAIYGHGGAPQTNLTLGGGFFNIEYTGSIGVIGHGADAGAGKASWGLAAIAGSGAGDNIAAMFQGQTRMRGPNPNGGGINGINMIAATDKPAGTNMSCTTWCATGSGADLTCVIGLEAPATIRTCGVASNNLVTCLCR